MGSLGLLAGACVLLVPSAVADAAVGVYGAVERTDDETAQVYVLSVTGDAGADRMQVSRAGTAFEVRLLEGELQARDGARRPSRSWCGTTPGRCS